MIIIDNVIMVVIKWLMGGADEDERSEARGGAIMRG